MKDTDASIKTKVLKILPFLMGMKKLIIYAAVLIMSIAFTACKDSEHSITIAKKAPSLERMPGIYTPLSR